MSAIINSDLANLRKRSTMSACIFANQGWCSFVGSLVTIIILACYKNVMEVVKGRKFMEVNMTFRRQHSRKLDGLSFPLDLAICRWFLGNSCVCYPLSPSHVTWVNSTFLILKLFYILVTLQWLNFSKCDMTISTYSTLHEETTENHLIFQPPLSKQAVFNEQIQKTSPSSFDSVWVTTRKFGSWLFHHPPLCELERLAVAEK